MYYCVRMVIVCAMLLVLSPLRDIVGLDDVGSMPVTAVGVPEGRRLFHRLAMRRTSSIFRPQDPGGYQSRIYALRRAMRPSTQLFLVLPSSKVSVPVVSFRSIPFFSEI